MEVSFANINTLQAVRRKEELKECNQISERFGLSLSEQEMEWLMQNRYESLKSTGRMEFGEGIIRKLVFTFCDSAYLEQEEYATLLMELQELFYTLKKETLEQLTDDELLYAMRIIFDHSGGSLEHLRSIDRGTLYRIACSGTVDGTYLEQVRRWENEYE